MNWLKAAICSIVLAAMCCAAQNVKISALSSGNPAQSGDLIPVARSGSNFSITAGSIAGAPGTNAYLMDDFTCPTFNAGQAGCLLWNLGGSGSSTASYTGTTTGNYWGAVTCATAATATNNCSYSENHATYPVAYTAFTGGSIAIRSLISATTNINFFAGIVNANASYGEGAAGYAGVAYSTSASDSGWMCVVYDGTTKVRTAVAGTLDTNFHTFTITWTAAKTIQCQVDGGTATSMASTHFPTDNNETPEVSVDNNGVANIRSFSIDYYYHNLTGLSR